MNGVGIFGLLASVLQLVIPSYALRLVRRFGAERVGWFLVAAFASLAAVHLAAPATAHPGWAESGISLDLVLAAASGLLLIGMGHIETMLSERQRTEREAQELERRIAAAVTERTAELAAGTDKMQQDIARRERQEKILRDSEMQYRALFTEHPQPMMILDLRTLGFLAVNHAAARQYGFATEEFLGMTIRDLVPEDAAPRVREEFARPCLGGQARGVWQHRKRDLSIIDVELTATDVKFGGTPARLLVAMDVGQARRREIEFRRAN
ncbi:MAG: PAS domain S-box protein, partial [Limisphaerales bacterium]